MVGAGSGDQRARDAARRLAALEPRDAVALAAELARRGVNPRAVRACFGVQAIVHAPLRAARVRVPETLSVAAAPLWLLVGGRSVDAALAERGLGPVWQPLLELGVVHCDGAAAHASLTLQPIGEALGVRLVRAPGAAGAPDDSSAHLTGALASTRWRRWLDVGTGNAYAPLACRGRAAEVRATDVDEAALECARAGARLSAANELTVAHADLLDGAGDGWDLITFNAPIPTAAPPGDLLMRFWTQAEAALAADGEVLVHSVLGGAAPRRGRTVIARYTPAGVQPAFGITRWQPAHADEHVEIEVELSAAHPHVRASALA